MSTMAEIVALDDMSPEPVGAEGKASKGAALKEKSPGSCHKPDINVKELAMIVSLTTIAMTIIIVVGSLAGRKCPDTAANITTEPAGGVSITLGTGFLWYPTLDMAMYVVHFNETTRQANYAAYIVPPTVANGSHSWSSDTYKLNVLPPDCYNQRYGGYQRGHLVPSTAFGLHTNYMANVVPMNSSLNMGVWRVVEKNIREKFIGKLAVVGCEYTGEMIPNATLRNCSDVYRPAGCYYVILDISAAESAAHPPTVLERLSTARTLLASGYYPNLGFSTCEKRLPYWLAYQGPPPENQCS